MSANNERLEALVKYFDENPEIAEYLFTLPVEEAVKKINAAGYDITCEDLHIFAESMDSMIPNQNCELDEESLDSVAGGVILPWWLIVRRPPPYIGTWEMMLRKRGRIW